MERSTLKLCRILRHARFLKQFTTSVSVNFVRTEHKLILKAENSADQSRNESPGKISTLYVPGRYGGEIYQIVKPVIDASTVAENIDAIRHSCDRRGIFLDFENLVPLLKEWQMLRNEFVGSDYKNREYSLELKRLKSEKLNSEYENLRKEHAAFLDTFLDLKDKVYDIEDLVMPLVKKIPNVIHESVPLESETCHINMEIQDLGFDVLSHVDICTRLSLLEFSTISPTAYYLAGKLSELDTSSQFYFSDRLKDLGFTPLSCVDFCKSFIIEAVGLDPYSHDECIQLKDKDAHTMKQKLNLVGGASFESFCAYFTNMNVAISTLPAKYFSLGRRYNAKHRQMKSPDLFTVVQSSSVHCLVLCDAASESFVFDELFNKLISLYEEFKIPFRTLNAGLNSLNITETRRKQLELWSPFQQKYLPVAHVSQHGDFISKRLHITFGVDHVVQGYCCVVEGVAVNIPVLIGCIVENLQNPDQTFDLPQVLKFLHTINVE